MEDKLTMSGMVTVPVIFLRDSISNDGAFQIETIPDSEPTFVHLLKPHKLFLIIMIKLLFSKLSC